MSIEQQIKPNVYPSAESVNFEPIAILPIGEGKILFGTQALIIQAILNSPKKDSFSSTELHEAIWPGQPYRFGSITPTMQKLTWHFADLGGTIAPRPYEAGRLSIYHVFLPEESREKIQIKIRKIPFGVTFSLPNGKVAVGEKAAALHQLIKDHLTPASSISSIQLWKEVFGDMPYSAPAMSVLLKSVELDLVGTDMTVEKVINYRHRHTYDGGVVGTHSSIFLNLHGFIDKLKTETAEMVESRIPEFNDGDILAFADLFSVYGAERILRAHRVNVTFDTTSALYAARAKITRNFENNKKKMPDFKVVVPQLKEKLLKFSAVEGGTITGTPDCQEIFAMFEGLKKKEMQACLDKLIGQYQTYKS